MNWKGAAKFFAGFAANQVLTHGAFAGGWHPIPHFRGQLYTTVEYRRRRNLGRGAGSSGLLRMGQE